MNYRQVGPVRRPWPPAASRWAPGPTPGPINAVTGPAHTQDSEQSPDCRTCESEVHQCWDKRERGSFQTNSDCHTEFDETTEI